MNLKQQEEEPAMQNDTHLHIYLKRKVLNAFTQVKIS